MKETERLIQLITRFGPPKLPLLNQATPKIKTLEGQLFENIKVGKYKNEEEALLDLYGSEDDYHKYRMLKSRLKQKLYNHLLFVEKDTIIAKKEEKQCMDLAFKGKTLLLLGEYDLAKKQLEKAISVATRYEFTEIIIECLEKMAFLFSQIVDVRLYNNVSERLKHFRSLKVLEDRASEIYYEARLTVSDKVSVKKGFLTKLPNQVKTLKNMWEETKSFNIFYKYNMLNGFILEMTGEFEEAIKDIEACEKHLSEGKINHLRFDSRLNKFSMVYALLRTKRYGEGLSLVAKYIELFPTYSRNWFAFQENHFLLALHSGDYELAEKVLQEVEAEKSLLILKESAVENWNLYKTFLFFVSGRHCFSESSFSEFSSGFPNYSKDKLGVNISILILQFLYLLKKRDFEQLTIKEETFRKYADTYLKNPYSKRSYYIFKLMLCIIRVDFDRAKSIEKGKPWIEKLRNTPEPGDAYSSIEIVPFENLWVVMLDYLQDDKHTFTE